MQCKNISLPHSTFERFILPEFTLVNRYSLQLKERFCCVIFFYSSLRFLWSKSLLSVFCFYLSLQCSIFLSVKYQFHNYGSGLEHSFQTKFETVQNKQVCTPPPPKKKKKRKKEINKALSRFVRKQIAHLPISGYSDDLQFTVFVVIIRCHISGIITLIPDSLLTFITLGFLTHHIDWTQLTFL